MILPPRDEVTELIIKYHHELEGHAGASHVLACVRREFWILKGMASVRRVISKCHNCRMLRAKPCEQIMAPLPPFRVSVGSYPFTYTGVDYFGPFRVRVSRSNPKRYGCLFTCLQTRAIHLEVAHSMSTDSFLMALMRFIDRRGPPDAIYSDNGTNFVGADSELKGKLHAFDQRKIGAKLLCRRIDWHFNPPEASHRGGAWERMITTVRQLLAAVTQEQIMGEEALLTYMIEVERIVNDRPHVPVYDDPQSPKILRPSDLLLLRPSVGLANDEVTMTERYTKAWRQAQHLASVFWKRWVREYLPSLQACHKWSQNRRDLKVGDLVLLIGGQRPVGSWPKGVVSGVVKGVDQHVREVYVRTNSGILRRDIRSLCLLGASE
ncbi:unnamed protein product [Calicophoron daubneyi]|uniref:Integrase catalytic domain-containing protein n=1 Tax=Calicophoron daubneyi TaxID=300641 RepID=A0AAV2TRK4_CALDB